MRNDKDKNNTECVRDGKDNNGKNGELERLSRLEQLIDRYAQSRSLGLWIPLALIVINTVLLVAWIELAEPCARRIGPYWTLACFGLIFLWVIFSSIWVTFKLVPKYGYSFYRKDGKIELKKEKIPICAWVLYIVPFLGSAILNATGHMAVRWALTISLFSFGTFTLYKSKKQKEKPLGVVGSVLVLLATLAIATGLIKPFGGEQCIILPKNWAHD